MARGCAGTIREERYWGGLAVEVKKRVLLEDMKVGLSMSGERNRLVVNI